MAWRHHQRQQHRRKHGRHQRIMAACSGGSKRRFRQRGENRASKSGSVIAAAGGIYLKNGVNALRSEKQRQPAAWRIGSSNINEETGVMRISGRHQLAASYHQRSGNKRKGISIGIISVIKQQSTTAWQNGISSIAYVSASASKASA